MQPKNHQSYCKITQKTEIQLTTQTERQQHIVQTCIVRFCSEIEEAWTFAM